MGASTSLSSCPWEAWSVSLYLLCKHVQTELAGSEECIVLDCATLPPLTPHTHTAREKPLSRATVDFSNTTVFACAKQTPG